MKIPFECKEVYVDRNRYGELPDDFCQCIACDRVVAEGDYIDDTCIDCLTQLYYDEPGELVAAIAHDFIRYPEVKKAHDRVLALYRRGEPR